jgi:hypothetical protein
MPYKYFKLIVYYKNFTYAILVFLYLIIKIGYFKNTSMVLYVKLLIEINLGKCYYYLSHFQKLYNLNISIMIRLFIKNKC